MGPNLSEPRTVPSLPPPWVPGCSHTYLSSVCAPPGWACFFSWPSLLTHLVALDATLQVLQRSGAAQRGPGPGQHLLLYLPQVPAQLGHLCQELLGLWVDWG